MHLFELWFSQGICPVVGLLAWASLMAQPAMWKNPPAVWKTWVRSLGWEDPLEKGKYSGLENSMDCIVHRVAKSGTRLSEFHLYQKGELWLVVVNMLVLELFVLAIVHIGLITVFL